MTNDSSQHLSKCQISNFCNHLKYNNRILKVNLSIRKVFMNGTSARIAI